MYIPARSYITYGLLGLGGLSSLLSSQLCSKNRVESSIYTEIRNRVGKTENLETNPYKKGSFLGFELWMYLLAFGKLE